MQPFKMIAVLVAAGCLSASLPAAAAVTPPDAEPATLSVTGQGQVSRAPDLATVGVTIETNDDSATRALSENNRRYAALVTKLAANGITGSDVTSTSLASYFNARPGTAGANAPGQLYGFVVTRNAQINVGVIAQTGAVIDAATAAGATQINGVSYGFRDRRAVERAALAAAVADAYAQAEAIASAAHVSIVRLLHIGTDSPSARFAPMAIGMVRKAEAPVPTTISPSDLDVSASVTVTYAIR
jgi:uncharacterized protein YggE